MNNARLKTLVIRFDNPITFQELTSFRGAIIQAAGSGNVLFHNHVDNKFRYAYPLIQYKRIGGKAAIVCVGEGTEAIGDFFNNQDFNVVLGERRMSLKIENIKAENTLVQVWGENTFTYTMRKYLPLNQHNYKIYTHTESLMERTTILESCLVGNILSFAKGVGVFFEHNITANILKIVNESFYTYKGIQLMGMDVRFKSNVSLPNYIGLGKNASLGFGMLMREKEQYKEQL